MKIEDGDEHVSIGRFFENLGYHYVIISSVLK